MDKSQGAWVPDSVAKGWEQGKGWDQGRGWDQGKGGYGKPRGKW